MTQVISTHSWPSWQTQIDENDAVAAYLYYGYLPEVRPDVATRPWANFAVDKAIAALPNSALVEMGERAFKSAFEKLEGGLHVVPLSGGLDSRAILAELCQRVERDQIVAITVGTPGTFDYEIPTLVARQAGVRHERINLVEVKLERDQLEQTAASNRGRTWIFDSYYNRLMRERFGNDAVYWSGFIGSRITSAKHLPQHPSTSWRDALDRFVQKNRFVHSADLLRPGFSPASLLPYAPIHPRSELSYDEQLDLSIRQECLVASVNLPSGFINKAPFLDQNWVQLFLSVQPSYKRNQLLYREILVKAYPEVFALPTKNYSGKSLIPTLGERARWQVRRIVSGVSRRMRGIKYTESVNYIDFDTGIRDREDLQILVRDSLDSLAKRGVAAWVDMDRLWREHMARTHNHAMALLLLVSLAIHLDASRRDALA